MDSLSQETRNSKGTNNIKICTHHEIFGHTIEVCYKKHQDPVGNNFFNNKQSQTHNILTQEDNNIRKDSNCNEVLDIRLTSQQYQVLDDIFKHTT